MSVVSAHLDRIDPASPALPAARILLAVVHGRAGRYREAERELRIAEALPGGDAPGVAEFARVSRSCWIDHRQARTPSALAATDKALAALEADESRDPMVHAALRPHVPGRHAARRRPLRRRAARRSTGPTRPRPAVGSGRWSRPWSRCGARGPWPASGAGTTSSWSWSGSTPTCCAASAAGAGTSTTRRAWRWPPTRAARSRCSAELELTRAALAGDQDAYTTALVRCDLVAALTGIGLGEEARRELSAARAEAIAARAPRAVARGELLAAALAPDDAAARGPLVLALALTRRYGLEDLWTRVERRRAAPLLVRALACGSGTAPVAEGLLAACGGEVLAEAVDGLNGASPDARRRLAELAEGADAVDAAALEPLARDPDGAVRDAALRAQARIRSRPRAPLRLVTLGAFSVLRGGTELSETALGRPRVRSLMAVLVAADGPLHRELLLEWLWPSLPPQRGLRSLHTTVFELRRALEPDAARLNGGSVVRTEGESYRLALGERDDWDVESFLALDPQRRGQRRRALARAPAGRRGRLHRGVPARVPVRALGGGPAGGDRGGLRRHARAAGRGAAGLGAARRGHLPLPAPAGPGPRVRAPPPRHHAGLRRRGRSRARPAPVPPLPRAHPPAARRGAEPGDPRPVRLSPLGPGTP